MKNSIMQGTYVCILLKICMTYFYSIYFSVRITRLLLGKMKDTNYFLLFIYYTAGMINNGMIVHIEDKERNIWARLKCCIFAKGES